MKERIIKIVIFAVAILVCILAITFSFFLFDDSKKENYIQTQEIKSQTPKMVADFETATVENLPVLIEQYQKDMQDRNVNLKSVQLEKDILYTYLQDLKNLDENSFESYQAKFSTRSESLFAKSDNKQKYVDGFNKVKSFKDLEGYIEVVNKDYTTIKQNYLTERNYIKSANALINRAEKINTTASESKKNADLQTMKSDLKSFERGASLQNSFIVLVYVLGLGAAFLMFFFLFAKIITNFKSSYKILVGLLLLVVAAFIGYVVGTSTLSPSAIKAGMTGSGYKMVNAAVFTFYICLFGAIFSIIATIVMNAVKNRN